MSAAGDWQLVRDPFAHRIGYCAMVDGRYVLAVIYDYLPKYQGWCINHFPVGSGRSRAAVWVTGIPTEEEAVARAEALLIAMRLAWPE